MNHAKRTLTEAVLARISLGAVPMGGFYWIDAKGLQHRAANIDSSRAADVKPIGATAGATAASPTGALKPKPEARIRLAAKWWHLRRSGQAS